MRVARKVMAVSELAWDLENDPRAEPPSVKPPVDVNAAIENEMRSLEPQEQDDASVVRPVARPAARPTPQRVRVVSPASSVFEGTLTKRMTKIDQRLLAIARGEIDPEGSPSDEVCARDKRPTPPAPRPTLVSATEGLNRALSPDHVPTKPVPPRFASAAEHQAVDLHMALATPAEKELANLDDPFGGLIPVNDAGEAIEVEESWLEEAAEPEPFSVR